MITALDLVQRVIEIYGPLLSFIRVCATLYAFYLMVDLIFDIVAANTPHKKIFWGGQQEPTVTGAFIKFVVASFLATFGLDDYLVMMLGQSLFGSEANGLVVIESYLPQAGNNELGAYVLVMVIGFAQIVGILAILRGLYAIVQRVNKEGKSTYRMAGSLIFLGALCYNIENVYLMFINTFGTVLGGGLFKIF